MPGMERARRFGGAGTPAMWEFALAGLAVQLECSTAAARYLVRDVLDVRHRLPDIWARLVAGEIRVHYARHVARATHHLSVEAAGFVDVEVAEICDGRTSWSRFVDIVEGKVVAADPEAAARREAEERAREFARATRSDEHGMRGFYIRSSIGVIARIEATVEFLAAALRALGDPEPEDQRRIKALLVMANPVQAVELLAAFAQHRARGSKNNPDADGGAGSGKVDEGAEKDSGGSDESAGGTDDGDAVDDELPIGVGDVHPAQNDADDAKNPEKNDEAPCPSCGVR